MAKKVMRRTPRSVVRIGLVQLEDRTTPVLFTAGTPQSLGGLNNNGCVVVGDLDKDGKPDAVLSNFGLDYGIFAGSKISILYGNGANGYSKSQNISTGGKNVAYVDLGDVNGDGWLDIAAGNSTTSGNQSDGSSVSIFLNDQAGGFSQALNSPFTTGFKNLSCVDLGDVNGDGKLDLIATHFGFDAGATVSGQGIVIYAGDGTGKFGLIGTIDPTTNSNLGLQFIPTNAQVADVNGDTVPDIVATVPEADLSGNNDPSIEGSVYVFAGTGGGAFSSSPQTYGSGGGLPVTLTLANVDGKNGVDILVGNAGDATGSPEFKNCAVGVLINNGSGSFATNSLTSSERGTFSTAAADFNLDGKLDIAAANYGSQDGSVDAFVSIYYGNGNGGFIPATLDGNPFDTGYGEGGAQFVAVGDFDLNSVPDLIVAHAPKSTLSTAIVQLHNTSAAPATSTTALSVNVNPTTFGQSVTFTAKVTASAGTAAGTVAFFDNGVQIGTGTLDASNPPQATFPIDTLGAGTHPITAKYLGGSGIGASPLSNTVSQVVNQATSGTTLMATPTVATQGTSILFTAVVTSPTTAPTGTVKFFEGATFLGSGTLVDNGGTKQATFSTVSLNVGVHTIIAQHVGTANILGGSSNTVDVTINGPTQLDTTTMIASSRNPSSFAESVTFTAIVTPASGSVPPSGTVNFFDGSTQIGTGSLSSSGNQGIGSFTTAGLSLGGHNVTAKYAGLGIFKASDSAILTQQVNAGTTTIGVVSDKSPATVTTSVTFTASVTGQFGNPTGTVAFFDNNVQIGTGTLIGSGTTTTATFSTSALGLGSHTITASYAGASGYVGSTSGNFTQQIDAIGTTLVVSTDGSPASFSKPVTFTAKLTSGIGSPTGTVAFFDNGVQIGTGALSGGSTTFTTSTLAPGSHTILAKYSATGNFAGDDSDPITQQIDVIGTSTALSSSGTPSTFGQPVLLTATITPTFGTPTGTVNFFDGGTFLGTGTLAANGGSFQATLVANGLAVGSHALVGKYAGATGYGGSDGPFTQVVSPIGTTATVSANPSPGTFGQGVTLTARVTAVSGSASGFVAFYDGTTLLGTGTLDTSSPPMVSFTANGLTTGTHAIQAKYAGGSGFAANDSPISNLTVNPAATTTTLTGSGSPVVFSTTVTFTAVVASTAGTPAGAVAFFDGGTQLGTGTLSAGAGGQTATFTPTTLGVGSHTISARYIAAGDFATSTSANLPLAVDPISTTITIAANPTTVNAGVPVNLTGTLTGNAGLPAGSVSFFDGSMLLSTVAYAPVGGGYQATFAATSLAPGSHVITAKYAGAAGINPADSAAATVTVNALATTTTLSSSGSPTTFGNPVTFTAKVAAASGSPTGTVAFFDGGVQIGTGTLSGGAATFAAGGLSVGSHAITANYLGADTFAASSATSITQAIDPAATATSLTVNPTAPTFGQPIAFTAVVSSPAGTPSGTVTFFDGTNALGTGTLATAGGQTTASLVIPMMTVGSHAITARFAGGGSFTGSESPVSSVSVSKAVATVGVSTNLTTVPQGQPMTVTAVVSVGNGLPAPTGSVTFLNGDTVIGTAPVTDGKAVLTINTLPVGTSQLKASYAGDTTFTAGVSASVPAMVTSTSKPLLTGFKEFSVGAGAGGSGVARFFNPDGTERFSIDLFAGFTGGIRVTSADFNGDGVADMVAGSGPGRASQVFVVDGKTKAELFRVNPFEAAFVGGVYVTTGDLDGDGTPELIITPDEGGGPRCDVYGGKGFGKVASFFGIDDPNFRGGARAAVSDVSGDGVGDLIVAAGFGGGPRVAGYTGQSVGKGQPARVFADFFAFEQTLRNGVFITGGDLDGDGKSEVIAGGGPGGGPRVTAFSGADIAGNTYRAISNFFAGNADNRGGVRLVVRDLDGDNRADLVVGDGTGAGSHVTGYIGKTLVGTPTLTESFSFDAFPGFTGGVFVG